MEQDYINYLEEKVNQLSDRVAELEAALAVTFIGVNLGRMDEDIQLKINDIRAKSKPYSPDFMRKFKQLYEKA